MKKLLLLTAFLFLTTLNAYSVDITWTGAAGDSTWRNPGNWSTNTVPTSNDNVTIPANTPTCCVYGLSTLQPEANRVRNYGNMNFYGCSPAIRAFYNYSSVHLYKNWVSSTINFLAFDTFVNDGNISSPWPGYAKLHIESSTGSFTNDGTIDVFNFRADVAEFKNGYFSTLEAGNMHEHDPIIINCTGSFLNLGTIFGRHEASTGINITAQSFTNNYIIDTGQHSSVNPHGGDLNVTADVFVNNERGKMRTGLGINTSHNGRININAQTETNYGRIYAGTSTPPPRSVLSSKREQIYFNDVFMAADSILIQGDSVQIEADTLNFIFNYMKVQDVSQFDAIWGDKIINFYATANGILDISQGNGQYIISVGYGMINIYCNNIIAPPQGINYIFIPMPNVYSSDTTYTNGYISQEYVHDTAGANGIFKLTIQNNSTANKSFNYSISSKKGWVTTMTGATQILAPFQFDSLMVYYTIPSTADTLIDTITQVLYVPGVFRDTVFSFIQSSFGQGVGIQKNQNYVDDFRLYQNYPNPFNPTTSIRFDLRKSSHVKLIVYDILGREIALLVNDKLSYGGYTVDWLGTGFSSGVYFYKLIAEDYIDMKKMVLVK